MARRYRVPLLATALAVPLYVGWGVWLATGGGDLAAQVAWAEFVGAYPRAPYSLSWYGGVHVGNYSLLAPQLMALGGVRTVTAVAGVVSSWLAADLFVRCGVRRPLPPALLAVLTLWCDVASGRSTFAVGVTLGLVACLVLAGTGQRLVVAGVFAVLATLASPVAGLFLAVAGAGWLLARRVGKAAVLCAPPALVVAVTTLLFPFSGTMPMSDGDVWRPVLFGVLLALLAPREWRALRCAAAVYAAGVVLTALVSSPVGSNVVRLAELFAPPVLLAALLEREAWTAGRDARAARRRTQTARRTVRQAVRTARQALRAAQREAPPQAARRAEGTARQAPQAAWQTPQAAWQTPQAAWQTPQAARRAARVLREVALGLTLTLSVTWVAQHAAHVLRMSTPVPAWAAEADGVRAALARLGAGRARVEVVPAVDHRETTVLGPDLLLARGWNRQLDVARGPLFYDGSFSPAAYRAWLDRWAVGYVVLPDGEPDWAARDEAALVRAEPGWLKPVWRDAHWRVYRVEDAVPLVSGAGATVVSADAAHLVVRTTRPGTVTVRVAPSPWLRTDAGCLSPTGTWPHLTAPTAGEYRITTTYLPGGRTSC
ncbi:hypothetical protein [Streptomyces sp. PD-S100-1]|uniref:hypothetical protein n=1 Tax=Streptomyces sp. PD-S100-1 TaxID=3394351 RepID=UPI0039BCE224